MKEVKLAEKHFRDIKDMAHQLYIEKAINYKMPELFVCTSYIEAFIRYCNKNQYVIKDGKVYVKKTNTK